MKKPLFEVNLLDNKTIMCGELSYEEYRHIVKLITNENLNVISTYLDELIEDLTGDATLNCINKLIVLLSVRAICIGNTIEYKATCQDTKKPFTYNLKISDIVSNLENLKIPCESISLGEYVSCMVDIPRKLLHSSRVDVFCDSISRVTYGKDHADPCWTTRPRNETDTSIFSTYVSGKNITLLSEIFEKIDKQIQKIEVFDIKSPWTKKVIEKISLSLSNNAILNFLMHVFDEDLLTLYKNYIVLLTQCKLDYNTIINSSPVELDLYMSAIKEIQKADEDNPAPTVPTIDSIIQPPK